MTQPQWIRRAAPIGAGIAVLVIVAGFAWTISGQGDEQVIEPGASTTGNRGGGSPGYVGSDDPPTVPQGPSTPEPRLTNPLGISINDYVLVSPTVVALSYTIGVPECYGSADKPVVKESTASVTVTLTRIEPKQNNDVACIDIALLKTVEVTLKAPLGSRVIQDGSYDNKPVPQAK